MEQILVAGACSFIGFHIAEGLLEQGFLVTGLDLTDGSGNERKEEMLLAIGRNANFTMAEESLDGLYSKIIVPLYGKDEDHARLFSLLGDIMGSSEKKPDIYCFRSLAPLPEGMEKISAALAGEGSARMFYLPTVYGPWQPDSMAFEAGIRNFPPDRIKQAADAEYRQDAIYIEDLREELPDILKQLPGVMMIRTGKSGLWEECAGYAIGQDYRKYCTGPEPEAVRDAAVYTLKKQTDPAEAIGNQIQHYKKLKLLKEWKLK